MHQINTLNRVQLTGNIFILQGFISDRVARHGGMGDSSRAWAQRSRAWANRLFPYLIYGNAVS
jgi:hypothetical protein